MSLYAALEVPKDADAAQIKAAHRRLVQLHHPDRGGKREDFDRVQDAYRILGDPLTRQRYDETGQDQVVVDNELSEIAQVIVSCFDQATGACSGQYESADLVRMMREGLAQRKRNAQTSLEQLEQATKNIAGVRSRLSYRGEGSNLLDAELESRIGETQRAKASVLHEMDIIGRAEAHAANYGYDCGQSGWPF